MGFSGIGPGSLLLILLIVLLLFGTKRLRSIGSDLGGALKGFRGALKDEETKDADATSEKLEKGDDESVIEGEATTSASTEKEKQ